MNRAKLSFSAVVFLFVWLCLPFTGRTASSDAAAIEQKYQQAKEYHASLLKDPKRAKARSNWRKGIDVFKGIQQANSEHKLASASLFMVGRMYRDLYTWSGNSRDLNEAIASYESVVLHYPKAKLADDALLAEAKLLLHDKRDPNAAARVLAKLIAVYPDGDMAAAAMAELNEIKKASADKADAPAIPTAFEPEIPPAPVSESGVLPTSAPLPLKAQDSSPAPLSKSSQKPNTKKCKLLSLKSWSSPDYTRVVIEASEPVQFKHYLLAGTGADVTKRLVIDLDNCRVSARHQPVMPVQDGLLKQVRSAQFSENSVRVVLDTQSLSDYKVFSLSEPFRVVVDVQGNRPAGTANAARQPPSAPADPVQLQEVQAKQLDNKSVGVVAVRKNADEPSIIRQLGLEIKRIVLDPGHGGKDCGAISPNGLKEKDITLKVAKKVAKILKKDPGYEVILTRTKDIFIPLEERTAIANSKHGDLFISIHVNSAPTAEAQGIETYFLSLTNSKEAMQVAARENATSAGQLSDLQAILMDLMQSTKIHESAALAELVQDTMVAGLSTKFENITNLGVKRAPFVVLIGARMPAVLAEIAFLSNPQDEKRLMDELYLVSVAEQIATGVSQYATHLNMAVNQALPVQSSFSVVSTNLPSLRSLPSR